MAWIRKRPVGLVYRDAKQSAGGYTLYSLVRGKTASLLDSEGRTVWRWEHDAGIQHLKMLESGNLLIQTAPPEDAGGVEQIGGSAEAMVELDWDSKVVWEYRNDYQHHDYQRLPNRNTLVIVWKRLPREVSDAVQGGFSHRDDPDVMWGDAVLEVDPQGNTVREWNSWEHFSLDEDVRCPLESRKEWTHANSIDVLPDGRWLLSFRLTSTVAIVDPESGEIVWRFGPPILSHQHAATWLENGHVLLFDNGCHRRGLPTFSQVLEIDPETKKIVWSYRPEIVLALYSFMGSGASRLPNGNTFVTEAATGRMLEVTPSGETVWEYVTPYAMVDPRFGPTPAVFRAYRYTEDFPGLSGRPLDPSRFESLERQIAAGPLAPGEELRGS